MPAKFTDEFVKAWLKENRPDFIVNDGWVYEAAGIPIPGVCAVCDTECSPTLLNLKNHERTHCASCSNRISPEDVVKFAALHGHIDVEIYFAEVYKARGKSNEARIKFEARIKLTCPNGHDVDMWLRNFRRSMGRNSAKFGGCKQCTSGGYDLTAPAGSIYASHKASAESRPGRVFAKVGITNRDVPKRIQEHESTGLIMPAESVTSLTHWHPELAYVLEKYIFKVMNQAEAMLDDVELTYRGDVRTPQEVFVSRNKSIDGEKLETIYDDLIWCQLNTEEAECSLLGIADENPVCNYDVEFFDDLMVFETY